MNIFQNNNNDIVVIIISNPFVWEKVLTGIRVKKCHKCLICEPLIILSVLLIICFNPIFEVYIENMEFMVKYNRLISLINQSILKSGPVVPFLCPL